MTANLDDDFIKELDAAFTGVGTDVCWERTIGGMRVLISPASVTATAKVNEAISKLDPNVLISESKRLILSNTIVGLGRFDLREFRDGPPSFPAKGREGKQVKVSLDKYMYEKIGTWGAQLVDDVFRVYSDLMESYEKENVKDVKFENAKDPYEELSELESRVHEMRAHLGLPELYQRGAEDAQGPDTEPPSEPVEPESGAAPEPPPKEFSPFRPAGPVQSVPVAAPVPVPPVVDRARELAELESSFGDSERPAVPPLRDDVLETPAARHVVEPPVVDKPAERLSPRFATPRR